MQYSPMLNNKKSSISLKQSVNNIWCLLLYRHSTCMSFDLIVKNYSFLFVFFVLTGSSFLFFFAIIIIILEKIATSSTNKISEKLSQHMHSLSRIPHSMHLFFNFNLFVFFLFAFLSCPSQSSFYYPYPPQKDKEQVKC